MKFWDTSAIVPLLVAEPSTERLQALLRRDSEMLVRWSTEVECTSALTRLQRMAVLDGKELALAYGRLRAVAGAWNEVEPSELVRESANRFLRVHPLRVADAFQLAAAFIAADARPSSFEIVALDERLVAAAQKEGFTVVDITVV